MRCRERASVDLCSRWRSGLGRPSHRYSRRNAEREDKPSGGLGASGGSVFVGRIRCFRCKGARPSLPKASLHSKRWKAKTVLPSELGATVGTRSLPVALVVFTKFRPGARWRPVALSQGQTVLAMMSHALCARTRPASVLATLARATAQATALRTLRGETEEVASSIANRVPLPLMSSGEAVSWR